MSDIENMKVRDVVNICDDWLYQKSDESDYWQNAFDFYNRVAGMRWKYLSEKETNWLEKIQASYEDDE